MGYLKQQFEFLRAEMKKFSEQQAIILESIEDLKNKDEKKPANSLLTHPEICKQYEISASTLRRWRADGLPFQKIGKKIYFDEKDIQRWFKTR